MSIDEDSLRIEFGSEVLEKRRQKKKFVMEVLSAEAKASQLLSEMPGRLCSNGATKSCSLYTKQGCKGVNQDSMLVWEDFASEENSIFCGVFDGHGANGHHVARKVRDSLPSLLALPVESLLDLNEIKVVNDEITDPNGTKIDEKSGQVEAQKTMESGDSNDDMEWINKRFTAAFHKMDESLKSHPKLSCMCSGTTAITVLVQGKELVVGNVGDSRAILARRDENGALVADQLTVDLKPDLPGEMERIRSCKGRVFALEDEPHVARLWLPHGDTPGLAMARALGDFCLKEYGLIASPQVSHRRLTHQDEFIVLATDGVWDVLSNEEVVEIVSTSSLKEEAAKFIVDAAVKRWKNKYGMSRTDDCAVVCHFIKQKLNPFLATKGSKKVKTKQSILEYTDHGNALLERGDTNQGLVSYNTIVTGQVPNLLPNEKLER